MALFDFLKRKKEVEKALGRSRTGEAKEKSRSQDRGSSIASGQPEKKVERVSPVKESKTKKAKEQKTSKPSTRKEGSFSYEMVKEPHISEKATILGEQKNQYTFRVAPDAPKADIKKAIEGIYHVDVLAVKVIKIPKKKRRIGRSEGFRKGYKKAVATIKEGQKIELF